MRYGVTRLDASCVGALLFANRVAPIYDSTLVLVAASHACRLTLDELGVSVLFTMREHATRPTRPLHPVGSPQNVV